MSNIKKKEKPDFNSVLTEINKLLVERKLGARDILHISRELETNATISLVFANLIPNLKLNEEKKEGK